jgi:hypothetical protein
MLSLGTFRNSLIEMTLLGVLTLSACGEKKEAYTGGQRPGAPAPQTTSHGAEGGAEIPTQSPDKVRPPVKQGVSLSQEGDLQLPPPGGPERFQPAEPGKESPLTTVPAPSPEVVTGPDEVPLEMNYTGSASDGLVKALAAKTLNPRAARSVLSAELNRTKKEDGYQVNVRLKFREAGAEKNYAYSGTVQPSAPAELVAAAGSEGKAPVARIKCVDRGGQCAASVVRLMFASSSGPATIFVIFREGAADLYFQLPGDRSANPEYATMRQFLLDSIQGNDTDKRVDMAMVKTFEVVGGRSGFEAKIRTFDAQMLIFQGPLAGASEGTALNVPVTMAHENGFASSLQDTLGTAALIKNNGKGVLEISATMRKQGEFAQDTFSIQFTRKLGPMTAVGEAFLKP